MINKETFKDRKQKGLPLRTRSEKSLSGRTATTNKKLTSAPKTPEKVPTIYTRGSKSYALAHRDKSSASKTKSGVKSRGAGRGGSKVSLSTGAKLAREARRQKKKENLYKRLKARGAVSKKTYK